MTSKLFKVQNSNKFILTNTFIETNLLALLAIDIILSIDLIWSLGHLSIDRENFSFLFVLIVSYYIYIYIFSYHDLCQSIRMPLRLFFVPLFCTIFFFEHFFLEHTQNMVYRLIGKKWLTLNYHTIYYFSYFCTNLPFSYFLTLFIVFHDSLFFSATSVSMFII